jgi:hypothetical protein
MIGINYLMGTPVQFSRLVTRRRGGPMVPARGPKGVAPARTHQRVPYLFYLLPLLRPGDFLLRFLANGLLQKII